MTRGQHVGGLSDSIVEDDSLSAHRAQARALAALARPQKQHRGPIYDIGDGDPCPTHKRKMLVIRGTNRQHCPDQSHDGVWKGGEKTPVTRAFWPLNGFNEAVRVYLETNTPAELPDIDLGGFDL